MFCVPAVVLLAPVMLAFGSAVHADMIAAGEQPARTRHPAVAVLTEDAPEAGAGGHGNVAAGKSRVPGLDAAGRHVHRNHLADHLPFGVVESGSVPFSDTVGSQFAPMTCSRAHTAAYDGVSRSHRESPGVSDTA